MTKEIDKAEGVTFTRFGRNCRQCAGPLEVVKTLPGESPQFQFEAAMGRISRGELREAVHAFSTAIRLKPDYYQAYYQRGKTRSALGDRKGMIIDFKESLKHAPSHWGPRSEMARFTDPPRGRPKILGIN